MSTPVSVYFRKPVTINTDPQRRCYNGCNFSEETTWMEWTLLGPYSSREIAQESIALFQRINPSRQYEIR